MEVTASMFALPIPSAVRTSFARRAVAPRITAKTSNARKVMCASAAIVTKDVPSRIVRQEASVTTKNSAHPPQKTFAPPHNAVIDDATKAFATMIAFRIATARTLNVVTTDAAWM
jgi:hypothetical protein